MTSRVVVVFIFCSIALCTPHTVRAAKGTVPPNVDIVKAAAIRGVPGAQAVIYRQHGFRLGEIVDSGGSRKLVWSRPLAIAPVRLASPGPTGLLQGVLRYPGRQEAGVFAYTVRPNGVVSALQGYPSGMVTATEGANFHGLSFTLRNADRQHTGSVKYRFETTYSWGPNSYAIARRIHVPDYALDAYPIPSALDVKKSGDTALIRLEVANTEIERNTGLMNRTSLDPDSGMIFVWSSPVLESFWMENTYIPLSVAFLSPTGEVQEIMDMEPLTTDLHTPAAPYQYAIEANLGYFTHAGITAGDTLNLHLGA